jgi:hypothetical protein
MFLDAIQAQFSYVFRQFSCNSHCGCYKCGLTTQRARRAARCAPEH